MARSSPLLMIDTVTSKFYSLAKKQLASLGDGEVPVKRLVEDQFYTFIVGSSHGWIAFFNSDSLELYLWNPVSRRFIDLPPIHNLPAAADIDDDYDDDHLSVNKLILSSSIPDDADCRAVMLYGSSNRLAFCCPGHSGAGWMSIGDWWQSRNGTHPIERMYGDLAYSTRQNRLFAITLATDRKLEYIEVERWDLEDAYAPRIDGSNSLLDKSNSLLNNDLDDDDDSDSNDMDVDDNDSNDLDGFDDGYSHIVIGEEGDEDEVLIVVRNVRYPIHDDADMSKEDPSKTTGFNVFKVVQGDAGQMTLTPRLRGSLNGLALFIGINESLALSATDFPELMPDSIYFTDEYLPNKNTWWSSSYGLGHYDVGVFDYQNRIFYPCYSPQQHNEEGGGDNDEVDEKEANEEGGDNDEDDEKEANEEEDSDGEYIYKCLPQLFWFTPTSLVD